MRLGVKLFVLAVFVALGLSFLATTGVLMWEFYDHGWLTLATFYSHLFIFFPAFGITALCAFYTPACVCTDLYWRHIRYGKVRFAVGAVAVAAASAVIATWVAGGRESSVFRITPQALKSDRGMPADCGGNTPCQRLPVMQALQNVREASQARLGLTDLARTCKPDPYVSPLPEELQRKRLCFASARRGDRFSLTSDDACCKAQKAFADAIIDLHEPRTSRSLTGLVHHVLLPGKVFFLLVVLIISTLLAIWRKPLEKHYDSYLPGIERGVLIGAAAMVIFPVMNHAFVQSAALLYGSAEDSGYRASAPFITAAFGVWALVVMLFFYRSGDKDLESLGRLGGVIGGGIAVFKYDLIIDVFVRVFGSGASLLTLGLLAVFAVFAIVALFVQTSEDIVHGEKTAFGSRGRPYDPYRS